MAVVLAKRDQDGRELVLSWGIMSGLWVHNRVPDLEECSTGAGLYEFRRNPFGRSSQKKPSMRFAE